MSKSDPSEPSLLTYHKPVRYGYATAARVPMPWWLAAACTLAATWPLLLTLTSPLGMGLSHFHFMVAFYGAAMWLLAYGVGLLFVRPTAEPSEETTTLAGRRVLLVMGLSLLLLLIHGTGIVSKLLFIAHYPLFEAERKKTIATLPAGSSAPRGWIGLFPVNFVHHGGDGEIGFSIVTGGGLVHDPTPASYVEFYLPPDEDGRLVGGWAWIIDD